MKNTLIVILIIVIIAAIGIMSWKYSLFGNKIKENPVEVLNKTIADDNTDSIDTSLNSIDTNININEDLKVIDTDLSNL